MNLWSRKTFWSRLCRELGQAILLKTPVLRRGGGLSEKDLLGRRGARAASTQERRRGAARFQAPQAQGLARAGKHSGENLRRVLPVAPAPAWRGLLCPEDFLRNEQRASRRGDDPAPLGPCLAPPSRPDPRPVQADPGSAPNRWHPPSLLRGRRSFVAPAAGPLSGRRVNGVPPPAGATALGPRWSRTQKLSLARVRRASRGGNGGKRGRGQGGSPPRPPLEPRPGGPRPALAPPQRAPPPLRPARAPPQADPCPASSPPASPLFPRPLNLSTRAPPTLGGQPGRGCGRAGWGLFFFSPPLHLRLSGVERRGLGGD